MSEPIMSPSPKAQLIARAALEAKRKAEIERIEREEREAGNGR